MLDVVGYSTAPEDVEVAQTRLDQLIGWLLTLPWSATFGVALASTLWLIWLSWPQEKRSLTIKSSAGTYMRESDGNPTMTDSEHITLKEIKNRIFHNETIILDGYRYISCTFQHCTLQWEGGEFDVVDPKWEGGYGFVSTNQLIVKTMGVMKWLKFTGQETRILQVKKPNE